jgi:hypothetical protein
MRERADVGPHQLEVWALRPRDDVVRVLAHPPTPTGTARLLEEDLGPQGTPGAGRVEPVVLGTGSIVGPTALAAPSASGDDMPAWAETGGGGGHQNLEPFAERRPACATSARDAQRAARIIQPGRELRARSPTSRLTGSLWRFSFYAAYFHGIGLQSPAISLVRAPTYAGGGGSGICDRRKSSSRATADRR